MQTAAMERCLEAAATEIDWELGYTELDPGPGPAASTRRRGQPRTGRRTLAAVLQPVRGCRCRRRIGADRRGPQHLVPAPPETRAAREYTRASRDPRRNDGGDRRRPRARRRRDRRAPGVPVPQPNPTPPALDIYPGAPFQTGAGFGVGQSQVWFTIRARVSTADQEAAMQLLLRMMDPNDPAIVEAAIADTAAVTPEGVVGVPRIPRGQQPATAGCWAANGG